MGVARGLAVVLAALVVAGCASDDPEAGSPSLATSTAGVGSDNDATSAPAEATAASAPVTTGVPPSLVASPTTAPAAPALPPPDPACAPGPDRIVTDLADDTVEAVVVPDYTLA